MRIKLLAMLTVIGFSGCSTLDGLNAKGSFDCKAPDGVVCDSMTGVMANAKANNLPGQQVHRSSKTPAKGSEYLAVRSKPTSSAAMPTMEYTGAPILRNPKTLRVWVAPWESADRTLFDQQFFYIVIDNWNWNIEHNSRRVRMAYAPSSASDYVAAPSVNTSSNQDSYKYRIEGDKAIKDDGAPIPVNNNKVESINPMPGKRDIDQRVTKELQNMNVDISQFTKPLSAVGN